MYRDVEQAKEGDRQAFERLVRRFGPMARAVAHEKLRDRQLAEDAVQEAFAEAYAQLGRLREIEAFPGWFKTIVARKCYRMLRGLRRNAALCERARPEEAPCGVEDEVVEREARRSVREAVDSLMPNLRMAVKLFYEEGYSLQEISGFLGTSVPALKKRLHDARRKLKDALILNDLISAYNRLSEGGNRVLHIVNGDSVAEKLRQGVVQGEILAWREVYTHGPVFLDPAAAANRSARADYLERTLGVPIGEYVRTSESQERKLADFRRYGEVVLWFEHDLFDQTMLSCLLHWFSGQRLSGVKLSLLSIGEFPGIEPFRGLGQLSAEQMGTLAGAWTDVGPGQLELGSEFWRAFVSDDPERLQRLLARDTSALPFAAEAFRAHLSRFPSADDGLGIAERATLELVREGADSPLALFGRIGDRLHALGMGDLQYWPILERMARDPHPLLRMDGSATFPKYAESPDIVRGLKIGLTELGMRLSNGSGEADWVAMQGIDEWYGGGHLRGRSPRWRWEASRQAILDASATADGGGQGRSADE